jgi:uncharacterized protein with NRDE domain
MSNSFMDDLSWPKTCILKGLVEKSSISTAVTPEEIRDELFDIMLTRPHCTDFPESSLIQTGPFDRDDFEELGNIFVNSERKWRTRSTVVVIVDVNGVVYYYYKNTENLEVIDNIVQKGGKFAEFIISKSE